jgi:hypothetical protein
MQHGMPFTKLWTQHLAENLESENQTHYNANTVHCRGYFLHYITRATAHGMNHGEERQVTAY